MSAQHDIDALSVGVPPYSAVSEQSVLGSLLIDNAAFNRIDGTLRGEHFYDRRHRNIWSAIALNIAALKPADVVTVHESLVQAGKAEDCGGIVYLSALAQSVPSASNIRRYAEIVREKAQERELIAAADRALTIALEPGTTAVKLDLITSSFGALERKQVRKMPRAMGEVATERIAHYTALEEGSAAAGWPTHISTLDRCLNGGLRGGNVYVLAARPAVGKSSFAQSIGQTLAGDGLPTLLLTMEMGAAEVADRGVVNVGQLSYSQLMTGKMSNDGWSRASEAMERLGKLPFFLDDQGGLTLGDIRAKAKSVRGLKVVIVDYLQLCAGGRRDGNRNAEIEEISRGLKTLAKELDVAVIAVSQLNRDVEKRARKRPTLSDLRDSGAIEQDADVVMFLWTEHELEPEGHRIVGLGVDKNRQGRIGEFRLDFHGDTQRWIESTAEIRPAPFRRYTEKDL